MGPKGTATLTPTRGTQEGPFYVTLYGLDLILKKKTPIQKIKKNV